MQEVEFSLLSCTGSFSPWSLTGWNERCFDLSANQLMASHKCFPVASLSAWGLLNTLHQEESHKVESNKNLTTDWKLYAKGHISFMKPTVEVKNTLKATTPPSLFPSSAPSPECKCTVQNSQLYPADSLYSKAIMGSASLSESSTPLPGTLQSVKKAPPQGPWWEPRPEASISALAEAAQRPGPAVLMQGGGGSGLLEPDGEVGHAPSPCHSNRPDICASWPVLQGVARLFWSQIYWLRGLCVYMYKCVWMSEDLSVEMKSVTA